MEGDFLSSDSGLTQAEIIRNATILDEGVKLCPLCGSEIKYYFINFNEKVQMCANQLCEYPFGHDEIIFQKEDEGLESSDELSSIRQTDSSPSITRSVTSSAVWSDLAKIIKVNDSDEQQFQLANMLKHKPKQTKPKRKEVDKDDVKPKLLEEIKVLHKKDKELTQDQNYINNKKWIEKLMTLQKTTGMPLLREAEIKMFKKSKPEPSIGELKIDIDRGGNASTSTIKIQIGSFNNQI